MNGSKTYANYPIGTVLISNLASLLMYILGVLILVGFGIWPVLLYILYCLWLEIRVLRKGCIDCYYYGKLCFSGKGLLCALFLKKGDPQRFACRKITWIQILPDFSVVLIPIICGIILSINDFNWLRIIYMAGLVILGFPATGYIRGNLACKYCKQRELGCPATELFGKKQ